LQIELLGKFFHVEGRCNNLFDQEFTQHKDHQESKNLDKQNPIGFGGITKISQHQLDEKRQRNQLHQK
jgi:hypothetical protein